MGIEAGSSRRAVGGPYNGRVTDQPPIRSAAFRAPAAPALGVSHVRTMLLVVLGVVAAGTAGYILVERWSLIDSLYMTIITMTTVGFREVGPLDEAGRVWTMLLAISGVGLIFGLVGIVAETVVVEATSGKREAIRMSRAVDALRDHHVLCGYGRVGSTVANELRHDGVSVVIIDEIPESLERARKDGFLVVEGDATDDATLRRAGLERARGLITTVDSDAANVYVILSARAINPSLFVVARANTVGAEARLLRAGADRVVSPYVLAGHRLAGLAIRPRVVDFIDAAVSHGELAFALEEVNVTRGGSIEARTVGELRDEGVFVLAVVPEAGGYEANPATGHRLAAGDTLVVSGSAPVLAQLRDRA
jgi:voltage-gated potassium channel